MTILTDAGNGSGAGHGMLIPVRGEASDAAESGPDADADAGANSGADADADTDAGSGARADVGVAECLEENRGFMQGLLV